MEPAREEGAVPDVRKKMGVLVTTASTMTSAPTVWIPFRLFISVESEATNLLILGEPTGSKVEADLTVAGTRGRQLLQSGGRGDVHDLDILECPTPVPGLEDTRLSVCDLQIKFRNLL